MRSDLLPSDQPFLRYAREYGEYWSRRERHLYDGLADDDSARRLQAIQSAAGYFKIARNFPTAFDISLGHARLAPVLEIIDQFRHSELTVATLWRTIESLRIRLAAPYGGGDRLSAATKLLWLLRRDPVIIYDSQARVALGAPAGNYARYVQLWRLGYAKHEDAIRSACATISSTGTKVPEFASDTGEEWFRQRVYDIFLWNVGAPS